MSTREGVTPQDPDRAEALRLIHQLREVTVRLDLAAREFARSIGLHATDVRALIQLLDAERLGIPATPSWLGDHLGMTSQATTAVINRLERAGHIERKRSPDDARSTHLMVSDEAVELGWSTFGPLLERMIVVAQALAPAQRATVAAFLTAITAATA